MPPSRLHRLFGDDSVIYSECRTCGKTLDEDEVRCPVCGSRDVVTYEWNN